MRWLLPILPALAAVALVEVCSARRGLSPPATSALRRGSMDLILLLVFFFGVFAPVAWVGRMPQVDVETLAWVDLFFLHGVLVAALLAWFHLGYGGSRAEEAPSTAPKEPVLEALVRTCGLRPPEGKSILREVGAGLLVGPFFWVAVLLAVGGVAVLLNSLGFKDSLPQGAPELVTFMASLPILLRLALSLSAGVVEEIFFRGFLQRRIGIFMSSLFFVLAHLTYEAPLMLIGVTFLSFLFASLTVVRGNVWPAVAAHALFDAVQLLWVVPAAVKVQGLGEVGFTLGWGREFFEGFPMVLAGFFPWPIW